MENKIELIERYLMNEMSVREQVEFEDLLRSDSDLMHEFLLRKNINNAILEEDVIDLRNTLNDIINRPVKEKTSRRIYNYSSIAAVIILLIIASGIFISPLIRSKKEDSFHKYYSTYPAIMSFRSPVDQNEIEKILYEAFNNYDNGNFQLASEEFKIALNKDAKNYMSQFYLAICQIENNKLDEAEEYLNDLTLKKNHLFWEQSYWYLALVYIKKNEISNAKSILKKIAEENMTQKDDAKKLLKTLN